RVDERERSRDAQAQRTSLAGDTATADPRDHVELILGTKHHERLVDDLLVHLVREVRVKSAAVDRPLTGARDDADPSDGLLAPPGPGRVAGDDLPLCGPRGGRGLRGLGGVLGGGVLGVERLVRAAELLAGVTSVVCGRLYASGLSHVVSLTLP